MKRNTITGITNIQHKRFHADFYNAFGKKSTLQKMDSFPPVSGYKTPILCILKDVFLWCLEEG